MLNPFPSFLVYSMLAPFIIRVVAGFIFIDSGLLSFKKENKNWITSLKTLRVPNPEVAVKVLAAIQIICGIMLVVGAYTQISAIILGFLTLFEVYVEYKDPAILKRDLVFYTMLFVMTISLLFSGAGAFAFDLPL